MSKVPKARAVLASIWQKAKKHQSASVVGIPTDMDNYELCQCCAQPVKKQPIPLCQHTKQLQMFGFGYPLWYSFLKYCIVLMLVHIASSSALQIYTAAKQNYSFCYGDKEVVSNSGDHHYNMVYNEEHLTNSQHSLHLRTSAHENLNSQFSMFEHNKKQQSEQKEKQSSASAQGQESGQQGHHEVKCTSFMVYLSLFKGQFMHQSQFLKVITFITHLAVLLGIRNMLQKQEQYYDQRTCSMSDYTLIIRNLPPIYGVKDMILRLFEQEFNKTSVGKNAQIKQFIYVFKSQQLQKMEEQRHGLQKKKFQSILQQKQTQLQDTQKKLQQLQHNIKKQITRLQGDIRRDYIKCDKVIIVMNSQQEKAEVIQGFEQGNEDGVDYSKYFKDHPGDPTHKAHNVQIEQAPQPNQINWEHIDESDIVRKWLVIRGWVFTFIFLALITVVFYFVNLAKTNLFVTALHMQQHNPNDQTAKDFKIFATVIVFVTLFGVVFFNKFVMSLVLHKFVHMQRHAYTDAESHSFAMKYALGMFFTTAVMTLAVEAITFKNFYSHPYGVIEQQTIMFFVTAFFIPLVWIINPYNLFKKLQFKNNQNTFIEQEKANELIQNFPYDLGKRYAQIFEIMWFAFLYSKLIPLGSFLILIGLVLYYWVDKYNFLRRSVLKAGISGGMPLLAVKSLDVTLFLAPAGDLIFDLILHDQINYVSIGLSVLAIIYLLIPVSDLIWSFNGEKFLLQEKTYDQAKSTFKQNYYMFHPVYKHTHKQWIDENRGQVIENFKIQFMKKRMYSSGKGSFKKDESKLQAHSSKHESELKGSQVKGK